MKEPSSKSSYKEIAEYLGIKYRIGRYGLRFMNRAPNGNIYKLWQIYRLDNILFGRDMVEEMRKRDFEL